jgi:hypothetical protein
MTTMEWIKTQLRNKLPEEAYKALRTARDGLLLLAGRPSLWLDPWRWESNRRLRQYQDRYRGKRCFVIGNGPSLKDTDLSFLKDEYTFGMNRVYLAFQDWGFQTSFLVAINDLVVEQCYQDFQDLLLPKFFSWHARKLLYPVGNPDERTHFLYTSYTCPKFASRLQERFWEGATVTYVCLQLAYCMGFQQVYLIGVDHSFESKGTANQTVVSSGEDRNHFSPNYFGKGFRWQLPDLETSEWAYRLADQAYLSAGRQVFDATIGGKLQVFPKVDYASLFS